MKNNENPLISIVVPVYNVASKFLEHMLDSIDKQTSTDFEAIIINDGSTNTTIANTLETFKKKSNKNIKVYNEKNRGLAGARNFGSRKSIGKWVMFLDGDDWLEFNTIEILKREILKSDNDLIIFGTTKCMGKKTRYEYKYPYKTNYNYTGKDGQNYLLSLLFDFDSNAAAAYSKIFKRELINRVPHNDTLRQGAEGIEFNSRLYQNFQSARFVNHYLYNYVYNGDSISAKPTDENNYLVIKAFEKIKENLEHRFDSTTVNSLINKRLQYVIITSSISGFFHPKNLDKYGVKKSKFQIFLKEPLIKSALKFNSNKKMDRQRLIILYLIRLRMYYVINLIAKIRFIQKQKGKKVI
ncbi:glycosyltransferase family A protein [Leuconostoc mesenteroides]|uniref:glycosyltransferase family A protein n=1 Tax=Leuconostoc mesenteroides TaxID=1245 RepID=UPI00235E9820|nr:glycosyltransferase family A protein [Leuconostoc mesenteroides]